MRKTIMRKGLLLLGTIVLSFALSPASGHAAKQTASAKGPCTGSFCQMCQHEGGTCSQGADACFCTF